MTRLLLPSVLFLTMVNVLFGDPLKLGSPAPVVAGLATDAGTSISLADVYAQHKYTVVYFYPKAGTPGCTAQGCSLRDGFDELAAKGVAILGVSTDSVEAQKKFKAENHFPFTLIADTDKKVIKAFGQSVFFFASREAYVVKDGKIVYHDTGVTTKQAENILDFISREPVEGKAAKPKG
jgi:peroxiredoxin Q/BCP